MISSSGPLPSSELSSPACPSVTFVLRFGDGTGGFLDDGCLKEGEGAGESEKAPDVDGGLRTVKDTAGCLLRFERLIVQTLCILTERWRDSSQARAILK